MVYELSWGSENMLAIRRGFVTTIMHDITMFVEQKLSNISIFLWFTLKASRGPLLETAVGGGEEVEDIQ